MAATSYRALGEEFSIALVLVGPDLTIRWTNPSAHRLLGYPEGTLIGTGIVDCLHPDDLEHFVAVAGAMAERAEEKEGPPAPASPVELPVRVLRASGGWTEMNVTGRILDGEGNALAVARPSAERHAFDAVLERLGTGAPLDQVLGALLGLIKAQFRVDRAWAVHDIEGEAVSVSSGPDAYPSDAASLLRTLRSVEDPTRMRVHGENWVVPVPSAAQDEMFGAIVFPGSGEDGPSPWDELVAHRTTNLASVAFTRDRHDRLLRMAASTDHLTGVMNRRQFEDNLKDTGLRPRSFPLALFFIDLDDFKSVNDRLGHIAGDDVLVVVAKRIGGAVRVADWLGRIGGDEFAVCCPGLPQAEVETTRARICAAVAAPITLEQGVVKVTASVGVATAQNRDDLVRLIGRSDADMFNRKRSVRRRFGSGVLPL